MTIVNKLFETIKATFIPHRSIYDPTGFYPPFQANVIIEEVLTDQLEITEHEVQQGAQISDHAYKKQPTITIRCLYSDKAQYLSSSIFNFVTRKKKLTNKEAYALLLTLQSNVIPIRVVTGKRDYDNALIKTISQVNDKATDNVLSINLELKQVFVTAIQTVILPPKEVQAQPNKTDSTKNAGKKILQEVNEKEKSILQIISNGLGFGN